jgi:hypothetical protein
MMRDDPDAVRRHRHHNRPGQSIAPSAISLVRRYSREFVHGKLRRWVRQRNLTQSRKAAKARRRLDCFTLEQVQAIARRALHPAPNTLGVFAALREADDDRVRCGDRQAVSAPDSIRSPRKFSSRVYLRLNHLPSFRVPRRLPRPSQRNTGCTSEGLGAAPLLGDCRQARRADFSQMYKSFPRLRCPLRHHHCETAEGRGQSASRQLGLLEFRSVRHIHLSRRR